MIVKSLQDQTENQNQNQLTQQQKIQKVIQLNEEDRKALINNYE